jgi:16S rRNA processing protein RimM
LTRSNAFIFPAIPIHSTSKKSGIIGAAERAPLDPGEYYHSDLIGCEVVNRATGQSLGKVTSFQDAGGGGLLVINDGLLFPFATGLCKLIDIANRRIEVEVPAGLLELNQP